MVLIGFRDSEGKVSITLSLSELTITSTEAEIKAQCLKEVYGHQTPEFPKTLHEFARTSVPVRML